MDFHQSLICALIFCLGMFIGILCQYFTGLSAHDMIMAENYRFTFLLQKKTTLTDRKLLSCVSNQSQSETTHNGMNRAYPAVLLTQVSDTTHSMIGYKYLLAAA